MAAAATAIAAALMSGSLARADAAACGTGHCVVLLEVNGLTPQDVSPEKTPFLWALAHPDQPNGAAIPSAALSAIGGNVTGPRAGWIWQAPRGVMSATNAAATTSLLTGAYPEKTGVPSDLFFDPAANPKGWYGTSGRPAEQADQSTPTDPAQLREHDGRTILSLVQELAATGSGGTAAKAYVGDPSLFGLVTDGADDCQEESGQEATVRGWRPGYQSEAVSCPKVVTVDPSASNPALCRPPDLEPPTDGDDPSQTACPADDMQTMNAAAQDVGLPGDRLQLTYAYLAELGITKQRGGNVQAALADLDAAVAEYVGSYAQKDPEKWERTVLMVVGNHGYELTPQPLRVPDRDNPNQSVLQYIEAIAAEEGGSVEVVPQGSVATVYYTGDQAARRAPVLKAIRDRLLALNDEAEQCNPPSAPRQEPLPDASRTTPGRCIDEVLYTKDPPEGDTANTVGARHPTWHVGDTGDAVVVMGRGWAAAPLVGVEAGVPPATGGHSNPYTTSDGGPRNRAVAALVHGPASDVNQFPWGPADDPTGESRRRDGRVPVTEEPATGDPRIQEPAYDDAPGDPAVEQANAEPGDDAEAVGHEQQPLTIDFMPTIAALLKVSIPPDQADGDIIQGPWKTPLAAFVEEEDLGEPEPEPEPIIIEEPPVIITPPPLRVFDFHGLIQNLKAQVGTVQKRTVDGKKTLVFVPAKAARRGSLLNYLALKADFGKPLAQITLTLYRQASKRSRNGKRRLVSIARFSPFTVDRGEGVELRFAVPPKYKPHAIGVLVQEAEKIAKDQRTKGAPGFKGFGPVDGGIYTIKNASMLHKRVGGKRKRR